MISSPLPAKSSIKSQIVWNMKMNINITNELKKLNRNLDKIYRSSILNVIMLI